MFTFFSLEQGHFFPNTLHYHRIMPTFASPTATLHSEPPSLSYSPDSSPPGRETTLSQRLYIHAARRGDRSPYCAWHSAVPCANAPPWHRKIADLAGRAHSILTSGRAAMYGFKGSTHAASKSPSHALFFSPCLRHATWRSLHDTCVIFLCTSNNNSRIGDVFFAITGRHALVMRRRDEGAGSASVTLTWFRVYIRRRVVICVWYRSGM